LPRKKSNSVAAGKLLARLPHPRATIPFFSKSIARAAPDDAAAHREAILGKPQRMFKENFIL